MEKENYDFLYYWHNHLTSFQKFHHYFKVRSMCTTQWLGWTEQRPVGGIIENFPIFLLFFKINTSPKHLY